MILLRGIKGHQYAEKIKKGIVDCRDLFTTVVNTNNTGYEFSDYYEKYFVKMFNYVKRIPGIVSNDYKKAIMALDDLVPYIYLTYFHIMNENSEEWVNSFDDDCEFIYYIPKLDSRTNQLIERDFFGDKIKYIDAMVNSEEPQKGFINYWLMYTINNSSLQASRVTSTVACVYNMLLYPLFFRVFDKKYNEFENEFRIFTIKRCQVNEYGEVSYEHPRVFNIQVDNNLYLGENVLLGTKNRVIDQRDMKLKLQCENNIFSKTDSLLEAVKNDRKIEYLSDFTEIKISGTSSGYGYIGTKQACINFIKENRTSFFYKNTKTRERTTVRHITPENPFYDYHFMPPWQDIPYDML